MVVDLPNIDASFVHLCEGDPVLFASDACLIVRRAGASCGVCREACPAHVLSGGQWSITLEEGCVGCGLCAAACPTGALMVEGCTPHLLNAAHATGEQIVLECRRVALADLSPNAVVVPCLGGLTTPDLLDFVEQTTATVVMADHGWCASCPVGGCNAPWQSTLDETRGLLGALSARLADSLVVERIELPMSRAMSVTALRPDKRMGRRDFLRRLVGAGEDVSPAESRRVVFGRGLLAPLKRERVLARIGALAEDLEQDFPASLMPAIKLADGCDLDGLCSAICPTGALRRTENENAASLQFDAVYCIACGECQRVCPNKALSLWPQGDGTIPDAAMTLAQRRTVACANCGENFIPMSDESFCPSCQKTTNLMRELVALRSESSLWVDETKLTSGVSTMAEAHGGERWVK